MNFTDLDDNTIAGAIEANADLRDFTGRYIDEFKQAAEVLGVEKATGYPLAVRSSSLLEDSQYQPFTGVYETFMLANRHPDLDHRLNQLTEAIRRVYASTFSQHAKSYVRATPFRLEEEKMAVILQQVVGTVHGAREHLHGEVRGDGAAGARRVGIAHQDDDLGLVGGGQEMFGGDQHAGAGRRAPAAARAHAPGRGQGVQAGERGLPRRVRGVQPRGRRLAGRSRTGAAGACRGGGPSAGRIRRRLPV